MKNKILIILNLVLATFVFSSLFFFVRANRPMSRAKKEAVEIAKEFSDIDRIDRFYWYTREESYFTLTGQDTKEKDIIVIIPQTGEKVVILNQKDGLSEDDAMKKVIAEGSNKITKVNLGLTKEIPTWEVVVEEANKSLSYYLVDFKTGEIDQVIKGI